MKTLPNFKDRLYSIQEAARFLGVNSMTLRRWEARGVLIPIRTSGNQRRYKHEQLERIKNEREVVKPSQTPTIQPQTTLPKLTTSHIQPQERYYTILEAAAYLGVTPMTLRRWEMRGVLLPHRTKGNQRRYNFELLKKFKKDQQKRQELHKLSNPIGVVSSQQKEEPPPQSFQAGVYQVTTLSPSQLDKEIKIPNHADGSQKAKALFRSIRQLAELGEGLGQFTTSSDDNLNVSEDNNKSQSFFSRARANNKRIYIQAIITGFVACVIFGFLSLLPLGNLPMFKSFEKEPALSGGNIQDVLAAQDEEFALTVNIPAVFNNTVNLKKGLQVAEIATLSGGLITNNQNGDFGTGIVIASNIPTVILDSVTAGSGISVTNTDPTSPTISNTGVLSLQGNTGAVALSAGSGIAISGLTISSTVPTPTTTNSFENIAVSGQSTVTAGSATDTLTFVAGSGVTLTTDTGTKSLTISAPSGTSQWTTNGTSIYYDLGNVGIGVTAPVHALELGSGTTEVSGIGFGTDVAIFRGAADRLDVASGDRINLVSGSLEVGGTSVITATRLVHAADGDASGPGLAFSSDINTGLFSGGADILGIATGGTERVRIENGNVGIGATTAPTQILDVTGNIRASGNYISGSSTGVTVGVASCVTTTGGIVTGTAACGSSQQYWQEIAGALSPSNITNDLLLGGISTDSAKFAFINNTGSGTPTASISGNIVLNSSGSLQTTNNRTLTIGGNTTGNIVLTPGNGSGTVAISSLSTGVVYNASGVLTSEAQLAIARGGTNASSIGSAGSLAYSNGTAYAFSSVGTSGQCLTSGGSGAPTWTDCAGANYWTQANGSLYPGNSTVDLLIGGNSTTSAKFAVLNMNSGIPRATISGDLIVMPLNGANGNVGIGTTNPVNLLHVARNFDGTAPLLRIENTSSGTSATSGLRLRAGAIDFDLYNRNQSHASGRATVLNTDASTPLLFTNLDVELMRLNQFGNLGIGTTAPVGKFNVEGRVTGKALVLLNETGNQDIFTASASGTPRFTIANNGTLTASAYSTGVAQFNSSGVLSSSALNLAGGASLITGTLPIGNGGTNTTSIGSAGSVPYSTGTAYAFSAVGSSGQCLTSGGSGSPTWADCAAAGGDDWDVNLGVLYPRNSTVDLVIGGTSTASAKFAVLGMNTGSTPVASLSATTTGLAFNSGGSIQSLQMGTLTLGGNTTGNIVLTPGNGSGTVAISNLSTGVLYNTSGVLSSEAQLAIARGGTNASSIGSAGSVAYSNGTAYAFSAVGNTGQCLVSNGAGTPGWSDCSAAAGDDWLITNGALYPINPTVDLLIGGTATSSAKFGFINVNSGSPTATIAGNLALAVPTGANPATTLTAFNGGTINLRTSAGGDAGATSRLYIANNGNLGIGTTTPAQKLEVGSGNVLLPNAVSNTSGNLFFAGDTAGGNDGMRMFFLNSVGDGFVDVKTTNSTDGLVFRVDTTNGGTERMMITAAGNVGIGTTAPTALLDISGATGASTSGILTFRGTTDPSINFLNGEQLRFRSSAGGDAGLSTRMTIQNDGNIGIGTTTADALVSLGSSLANSKLLLYDGGSSEYGFGVQANEFRFHVGQSSADYRFYDAPGGNALLTLKGTGNMGLGTTSPDRKLDVLAGGTETQLRLTNTDNSRYTDFRTNEVGNLQITPTGGAATLSASLAVAGGLIATPGTPTIVGTTGTDSTNFDSAWSVAVQGRYAYMTASVADTFSVIDISTPSTPVRLATIGGTGDTNLNGAAQVVVNGKYAYIAASAANRLTIVDISDPSSPQVVGSVTSATQLDNVQKLDLSGKYVYLAAMDDDRITAVDVSDPYNPVIVGSSPVDTSDTNGAYGIYVQGKYAYLATRFGADGLTTSAHITVLDISDPTNITKLGSMTSANLNDARGVYVSGRYAYVTGLISDTLVIFDVSNPYALVEVGVVSGLNGAFDVMVGGKYAYVTTSVSNRFNIIDVSDPASPTTIKTVTDNTLLQDGLGFALTGRYAYIPSSTSDMMTIVDLGYELPTLYAGALGSGQLFVENDGIISNDLNVGNGLTVGSTITANEGLASYFRTASASAGTQYGISSILSDTGAVSTGTDTTYGVYGNVTRTGAVGGTINTYGGYFNVTGDTGGTSTAVGLYASATGADNNYAALFANGNVGIGTTAPIGLLNVSGRVTGRALVTLNETGNQDIFTASASGTPRFSIANSGTITANAYSTGVAQFSSAGVLSSSALNLAGGSSFITGTLPIGNGGTNASSIGSAGSVAYSTGTAYAFSAVGTSGQCLASGGASTPTWTDCAGANYWQRNSGALAPTNISDDVLIGGASTSSAKIRLGGTTNADSFFNTGGNVGIATTAPVGKLNVNGSGNQQALVQITGDSNQDLFVASVSGSTRLLIDKSGNIGIGSVGVSGLGAALDLRPFNGTTGFSMSSNGIFEIDSSGVHGGRFRVLESGNLGIGISAPTNQFHVTRPLSFGATGKALAIFDQIESQDILTASASGTTRFVIKNDGNVGIGTSLPSSNLEVAGNTPRIRINATSNNPVLDFAEAGNAIWQMDYVVASDYFRIREVGQGDRLVLQDGGNIGISNTAPRARLDLTGSASVSANLAFYGAGTAHTLDILDGGTLNFRRSPGGTAGQATAMFIGANGNIGIGTTTPSTPLQVNIDDNNFASAITINNTNAGGNAQAELAMVTTGGTGYILQQGVTMYLYNNANGGMNFHTNGLERMKILAGGAVGIGHTNPASELTVSRPLSFDVTGKALAVFDQLENQDILAASSSGTPRFAITNAGGIKLGTNQGNSSECLLSGGTGAAASWGSCASGLGNTGWNLINGAISPVFASTVDLLLGGTATSSAKFAFMNVNSGNPTASISGNLALAVPTGANPATTYTAFNGGTINLRTSAGGDTGATSRLYIANDGNVGIGTTAPALPLQLVNATSARIAASATGADSFAGISLGNDARVWLIQTQGNDSDKLYFHDTTAGFTRMVIDASGNIGMGTAAPTSELHVTRPASYTATGKALAIFDQIESQDIFTASASGTPRFAIANNGDVLMGTTTTVAGSGPDLESYAEMDHVAYRGTASPTATDRAFGFFSSSGLTNVMQILNNGNVGMGTTAPVGKLNVTGDIGWPSLVQFNNTSNVGDTFTASKAGTTQFVIKNSGNVGIGTTNPLGVLGVRVAADQNFTFSTSTDARFSAVNDAGSSNVTMRLQASDYKFFNNIAALQIATFASTGNIGFGTTAPTSELHVTRPASYTATGKALVNFDQIESQDIFTASASGTTRLVLTNAGRLGFGTGLPFDAISNTTGNVADSAGTGTSNGSGITWNMNTAGYVAGIMNSNAASNANGILSRITGTASTNKIFTANSGGVDRFIVLGDGNVGIGTTTPAGKLMVNGTTNQQALTQITGDGNQDLLTASVSGVTKYRMDKNGSILFQGNIMAAIGSTATGTSPTESNELAMINAGADQGSLLPNSGFESTFVANKITNNSDPYIVDGWVAAATMSAAITRVATDSAQGDASLLVKLNASEGTAIFSPCIPMTLGGTNSAYTLSMWAKASVTNRVVVRGYIDAYTSKANCQSNTSGTVMMPLTTKSVTTTYDTVPGGTSFGGTAVAGATWGRAHVFIGCPASCTTGTTVNIDGVRVGYVDGNRGLDYAENYPADPNDTPQPGDVVSIQEGGVKDQVGKSSIYMDQSAIGIVSTNPGQVLDDGTVPNPKVPVALAGRVPVKVSTANGPIRKGDYLTTSIMSGVAVKAIKAGPTIGKAMSDFTCEEESGEEGEGFPLNGSPLSGGLCTGEVTAFVNVSYYSPAEFAFSDSGNVSIFKNPEDITGLSYTVKHGEKDIERKEVFSDIVTGVLKTGVLYGSKVVIDGKDVMDIINEKLGSGSMSATESAQINTKFADMEGVIDNLTNRVSSVEQLAAQTASDAAFLKDLLAGGGAGVLGASDSASFADLGNVDVGNLTVGHDLTVLGRSTLGDVGITGTLTAGVISIDGLEGSLNTVGEPLKIQSLAAASIDFMNGKVVMETNGNMKVKGTISTKKINIDTTDANESSIGTGTIESSETTVTVNTTAVTSNSKVFLTPTSEIDIPLVVSSINGGTSFTVKIVRPQSSDVKFNWWIVN